MKKKNKNFSNGRFSLKFYNKINNGQEYFFADFHSVFISLLNIHTRRKNKEDLIKNNLWIGS